MSSNGIVNFNSKRIENLILDLADEFRIRIQWNKDTAILTGTMAIAGGLIGGYAGGRMGAALGAGIGGATGYGVASFINLREIWEMIKENVKELLYIVFNYLRHIDPVDYHHAYQILKSCMTSRRELVLNILEFITEKLGRQVLSSITQHPH